MYVTIYLQKITLFTPINYCKTTMLKYETLLLILIVVEFL